MAMDSQSKYSLTNNCSPLGLGVDDIGDVDGGGIDDIATGAPALDGTHGLTFEGRRQGNLVGRSVNEAGDVNRNGADDFAVGNYGRSKISTAERRVL